jgi:hypothetical protein
MLKTVALLFALIGVVPAAFAEAPVKTIPPEEAPNFHGQLVTVKGVVSADTTSGRGNRFLNMGGTYPNQALTGWIPTRTLAHFLSCPTLRARRAGEGPRSNLAAFHTVIFAIKLERYAETNHGHLV